MNKIEKLLKKHSDEIIQLRASCPHNKIGDWIYVQWAPGHIVGKGKYCCECASMMEYEPYMEEELIHGKTCYKIDHGVGTGYLHDEKDDTPYDVDGCTYCGRCHVAI